jgi:hypothetical protein
MWHNLKLAGVRQLAEAGPERNEAQATNAVARLVERKVRPHPRRQVHAFGG